MHYFLSFLLSFAIFGLRLWGQELLLFLQLLVLAVASKYLLSYCYLRHDDEEVRLFESKFLDLILIASSFSLKDNFLCLCRDSLFNLDSLLENTDLHHFLSTV